MREFTDHWIDFCTMAACWTLEVPSNETAQPLHIAAHVIPDPAQIVSFRNLDGDRILHPKIGLRLRFKDL